MSARLATDHLAVAPFEAFVRAVRRVLDEPPVPSWCDLETLDFDRMSAAPPLCDEVGLGGHAPDALARSVEDALDVDHAVGRGRHGGRPVSAVHAASSRSKVMPTVSSALTRGVPVGGGFLAALPDSALLMGNTGHK